MILAIETSTNFASVALVAAGEAVATAESEARTHSERLIDLIDEVLEAASISLHAIDGVAIGAGPGSFTGLRIGMATAKGLCFAAEKPLWVVSSLAALAAQVATPDRLLVPVLDARRGEVFAGFFERAGATLSPVAAEIVVAPEALEPAVRAAAAGRDFVLFGEGAALYPEILARLGADSSLPLRPTAAAVGLLAYGSEPAPNIAAAVPVYIRKSEAEIRYPDGNAGSYAPPK